MQLTIGNCVGHQSQSHTASHAQAAFLKNGAEDHDWNRVAKQSEAQEVDGDHANTNGINCTLAVLFHQDRRYEHYRELRNGDGVRHPTVLSHVIENIHGLALSPDPHHTPACQLREMHCPNFRFLSLRTAKRLYDPFILPFIPADILSKFFSRLNRDSGRMGIKGRSDKILSGRTL